MLIRTIGRSSLAASIESVKRQTYTHWELILANAGGVPLDAIPMDLQTAVTRQLDFGPVIVDKSTAANALIDAARGEYAIFLDDDDWFLDGHLEKLVSVLDANPDLAAAYSDTQCVEYSGNSKNERDLVHKHLFDYEFDPVVLQLQNYLPIHSVMFRRAQVVAFPPSRFDPDLTLFEDWDFWLQLAAKASFQRVSGVSCLYALSAQAGSGHASQANALRTEMLQKIGARQLQRWTAADVVSLIEHHNVAATEMRDKAQRLEMEQSRAEDLSQRLSEMYVKGAEAEQNLAHARDTISEGRERLAEAERAIVEGHERLAKAQDTIEALTLLSQLHETSLAQAAQASSLQAEQLDAAALAYAQLQAYSQLQQQEIVKLGAIREAHLAHILEVQQSHSWRVTRPLREIRELPNRMKTRLVTSLPHKLMRAVVVDVAKNGPAGFLRRLPNYLRNWRAYTAALSRRPAAGQDIHFVGRPAILRNLRLHPDLLGGGPTLDAKVSVVIPTLNAGGEFKWLLRKLNSQLGVGSIEVVIVDSGSRDDTIDVARLAGAKVIEIRPDEFTHSYARNLGADHATGDYVLFMVQDAYPIGSYWMYAMLRYLLDHADQGLVAASCSEYSRADSDMMYDSMINTHYKFLGCLELDRIGEYTNDDHMSLRSQGQLSDVSCLISRQCFQEFRYRGNYAEDLDLGVRLIQSGKKVAMLAHVKVIHSHNRPAYYYLKRSFVDVIFLVEMFNDFTYPKCQSLQGLLNGIESSANLSATWIQELLNQPAPIELGEQLQRWIDQARRVDRQKLNSVGGILGDDRLDQFVLGLSERILGPSSGDLGGQARGEALRFLDTFLARLEHFNQFALQVYGGQDAVLRDELCNVVRKTFAAAAGSALAFYCLDHADSADPSYPIAQKLRAELAAGV